MNKLRSVHRTVCIVRLDLELNLGSMKEGEKALNS